MVERAVLVDIDPSTEDGVVGALEEAVLEVGAARGEPGHHVEVAHEADVAEVHPVHAARGGGQHFGMVLRVDALGDVLRGVARVDQVFLRIVGDGDVLGVEARGHGQRVPAAAGPESARPALTAVAADAHVVGIAAQADEGQVVALEGQAHVGRGDHETAVVEGEALAVGLVRPVDAGGDVDRRAGGEGEPPPVGGQLAQGLERGGHEGALELRRRGVGIQQEVGLVKLQPAIVLGRARRGKQQGCQRKQQGKAFHKHGHYHILRSSSVISGRGWISLRYLLTADTALPPQSLGGKSLQL